MVVWEKYNDFVRIGKRFHAHALRFFIRAMLALFEILAFAVLEIFTVTHVRKKFFESNLVTPVFNLWRESV